MLTIDVQKVLGSLELDIKLDLPMQGITAVFGRSGTGKTSLINVLSGLSKPDKGSIQLGDRILCDSAKGIFQPPEKKERSATYSKMLAYFRIIP